LPSTNVQQCGVPSVLRHKNGKVTKLGITISNGEAIVLYSTPVKWNGKSLLLGEIKWTPHHELTGIDELCVVTGSGRYSLVTAGSLGELNPVSNTDEVCHFFTCYRKPQSRKWLPRNPLQPVPEN
jgi:hypothetical protein